MKMLNSRLTFCVISLKSKNIFVKKKIIIVSHTDPVPGEHLSSVLVDDLDNPRWLDPSFSIHLHWNTFITFNSDFYLPTLFPHTHTHVRSHM